MKIDIPLEFHRLKQGDHYILLQKLEMCGIKNNSLKWFQGYLLNRKKYVQFNDKITTLELV